MKDSLNLKEGQSNVKYEDWALFLKSFDRELAKLQAGVCWSKADKTVYGWSVEEALTNVRVVNLGYDVPENVVTDVLSRYGTIVFPAGVLLKNSLGSGMDP